MHRFLSLLLIPLFLVAQLPRHAHSGYGMDDPHDHSLRPHFHLFGMHAHTHASEVEEEERPQSKRLAPSVSYLVPQSTTALRGLALHDEDAIYLAEGTVGALREISVSESSQTTSARSAMSDSAPLTCASLSVAIYHTLDPGRLPLYLLFATLRL